MAELEDVAQTFKLRKFKMSSMQDDKTVLLLGKRNTGKSTLLEDMLYHLSNHFDMGVGMTLTQDTARSFRKYIPDTLIHNNGVQTETLTEIIDMLRRITEADETGADKIKVFAVLDDIASQKGIFNSETMRDIFMNGRHYHIFFVVLLQYVMDMPPAVRSQIDYLFVLRCASVEDRKKIWKNFFGIFPDFDTFCEVFDACTDEFDCIVLDNTVRSNRIEDCVFWYRAEPKHPNFTLCNRDAWKLHYHFYDSPSVDFGDDGCPLPALAGAKKKQELKDQQQNGTNGGGGGTTSTESGKSKEQEDKASATNGGGAAGVQKRRGAARKKAGSCFTIRVEKKDEQGNVIIPIPPPTPAMMQIPVHLPLPPPNSVARPHAPGQPPQSTGARPQANAGSGHAH